ncbi:MAG: sulfatase, partial [Gemmatimonadota bacterium]
MLRRLRRFYLPLGALAVLTWVVTAFGWMPGAIRAAHAGGGLGILRRAMAEAAQHPVSAYLDQWDAFARLQLFHLFLALAAGYVLLRLALASRGRDAGAGPGADATVLAPVMLGLWFGLLSGFGEGFYVALRTGVLRKLVHDFYEANLVTALLAPVMNALLFAAIGALIAAVTGRRRPATGVTVATVLFTGLTVAGWALLPGRVNLVAGLVLGAGAAAQAGRMVAGRTGRFAQYARTSLGHGVVLLAMLAGLRVAVPELQAARVNARLPQAPAAAPDILWVVLDTERAKSLELYGRTRQTTPFLSRLAGESIVFDAAIAPSSWTLPSHASMFTGRRAREMTVWDWTALEPSQRTIAEVLRDRGYRTAGFAGNLVFLNPSVGLSQGFTEWSATVAGPGALLASTWIVRSCRQLLRKLRPGPDYFIERDAAAIDRAVERWFGRRRASRPFFVFINYFDAHEPFRARPASLPEAGLPDRMFWYSRGTQADDYTADELTALRDAYESEIAHLDGELERLFSRLSERGVLDRAIVVITADHGEQFGEHGLLDHSNSLYRPLVHVPLLIRLPGGAFGGTRVERPVGIRNIGATLLDIAGIERTAFPGTSFASSWTGKPDVSAPVYASMRGWQTVFANGFHFIVRPDGTEELYRMEDRHEAHDLASDPAFRDVTERLRALLPE